MMDGDQARKLAAIRLLVLDVDGVLTDGGIIIHSDGTESKCFHVQDGHGIKLWHRAGGITAVVSGRTSGPTEYRARQLDIAHVLQGQLDKLPAVEGLLRQLGLGWEHAAVVGDDVLDIPTVRRAGFGVAVANAVLELKAEADFVTSRPGGHGAVREVIELILKAGGRWTALMERYER